MTFSKEEIIARYQSDSIDILSMKIVTEGFEEQINYSIDMDPLPQEMILSLPEYSTYVLSFKAIVKKDLKDVHYYQAVTKAGITVNKRRVDLGDFTKSVDENDVKDIVLESHQLPGGMFVRGTHPAHSYFAGPDDVPIISFEWRIEISKRGQAVPHIKV